MKQPVKQSVWMCACGHYHNDLAVWKSFGLITNDALEEYFSKGTAFGVLPEPLQQEYIKEAEALIAAGL